MARREQGARQYLLSGKQRLPSGEPRKASGRTQRLRDVYGGLPEAVYREPNYAGRIISAPTPGSHGWRRAGIKGCARQAGRASGAPR
jgi:hypothetical protein